MRDIRSEMRDYEYTLLRPRGQLYGSFIHEPLLERVKNINSRPATHLGEYALSVDKLRAELGKVKGYVESLKVETARETLDRLSQRPILIELKLSLERVRYLISKTTKTNLKKLKRQAVDSDLGYLIRSTNSAIYQLDSPSYYKDEDVRRNITNLIFFLDSFITNLTDALSLRLTGIAQIGELISTKPAGLDENWAVANCYLSAMEIVINRKLIEEGVKTEEKDFPSKFKIFLKVLENKGVKVSELEKELPSAFWKLRHKVVHAGYSPTQEELDLIITWVKKVIRLAADRTPTLS